MHFKNNQEYLRYFNSQPVEPEKYIEPPPDEVPKKRGKKAKDGEVLQTD